MPALDPFSAASRPMLPFDTLPSRPLQFAATLHPIDLESPTTSYKQLKPRRQKESTPEIFPSPQYSLSRHAIPPSLNQEFETEIEVGSDEWMQAQVARCVDTAKGDLDIANKGLKSLSTKIVDLRDLVTLPSSVSPLPSKFSSRKASTPPRSPLPDHPPCSQHWGHLAANARSFSRTSSAPASSAYFNASQIREQVAEKLPSGLGACGTLLSSPTLTDTSEEGAEERPAEVRGLLSSPSLPVPVSKAPLAPEMRTRSFGRSKTGVGILSSGFESGQLATKDVGIYAGQNALTSLPSALFDISNLTVLSLRGNQLTQLPGAIGELHNLKELNISNNQITLLPSTILNLALTQFSAHPNPFLRIPPPASVPTTTACTTETLTAYDEILTTITNLTIHSPKRILSPLVSDLSTVPRLSTMCLNLLISPRQPSNLPPLLDAYDWDIPAGQLHPLLDPASLHQLIPHVSEADLRRVLQALKSAGSAYAQSKSHNSYISSVHGVSQQKVDPFPRSHRFIKPDDAYLNPWFCPCPSPRHLEYDSSWSEVKSSRRLFLNPSEERLEWREVFGISSLPVKWLGCSPGCLAFLKKEEGDDWGLED